MSTYFTDKTFRFLRALARNNERPWFEAHRADYEAHYAAAIAPHEGNAWVTEVATTDTFRIGSYVSFDDDGVAHYAEPDWRVATRGLSGGAYLTRLTADLPSRFLTDDLVRHEVAAR